MLLVDPNGSVQQYSMPLLSEIKGWRSDLLWFAQR